MYMPSAYGSWRRKASLSLELEMQTIVSSHVGAENQTEPLKNSLLSWAVSPRDFFLSCIDCCSKSKGAGSPQ